MKRKSYYVEWPCGCQKYFRLKRDGGAAFNGTCDEEHYDGDKPVIGKVFGLATLTADCFERAYNGGGGFVESETVIESR